MKEHPHTPQSDTHWDNTPLADQGSPAEGMDITLQLSEPELIAEISAYPEGRIRDDFIKTALRIGIIALRQAEGKIDAQSIKNEGERLLKEMDHYLSDHRKSVTDQIAASLKDYFDPTNGRFQERLERLLKQDGELEQVLRRQVGSQDSVLAATLGEYLGDSSRFMQLLGPENSSGFLQSMNAVLEKALESDRERILKEFSLDNNESALNRLVRELNDNHGKLTGNLQDSIKEVVSEFSLDNDESALSRLVNRVERTQKQISSEFSLDADGSALARMKRELLDVLDKHKKDNTDFQQEVRTALADMTARKEEAARSTIHGNVFEEELFRVLQDVSQKSGDIATSTGNTTGQIKNCKVGDVVIELGPEHVAAGTKIVIEAKDSGSYDIAKARQEIEVGRKNRGSEIGIFVFSRQTAPEGLEILTRYGNDILTLWDIEDSSTDVFLNAAVSVARALCTRAVKDREGQQVDFDEMDRAIRDIEKQLNGLADITKWGETIKNSSEKIVERARIVTKNLTGHINVLDTAVSDLKRISLSE